MTQIAMEKNHFFLIGIFSLAILGCGKDIDRTFGSLGPSQANLAVEEDRFIQERTKKVDILFVVDTSGSVRNEREAMANGIESLLNELPPEEDFNIGVIPAHLGTLPGKLYQAGTEPFILKSSELSRAQIRENLRTKMVSPPNNFDPLSDGGEAGFYSISQGIKGDLLKENQEKGIFRSDAALTLVFISDENDVCSRYLPNITFLPDLSGREVSAYSNFCVDGNGPLYTHEIVLNALLTLKEGLPLTTVAAIYTGENPIPPVNVAVEENEIGHGFKELVELEGGFLFDLADPEPDPDPSAPEANRVAQGMKKIGSLASQDISQLRKVFSLSRGNVIADTIVARVDGVIKPHTYDSSKNQVTVEDTGGLNSEIVITYQYRLNRALVETFF